MHLDNYVFQDDAVGHRFADALKEKAADGVAMWVIYDRFGSSDVPRYSGVSGEKDTRKSAGRRRACSG